MQCKNHTNHSANFVFLNQHYFDSILTKRELCVEIAPILANSKSGVKYMSFETSWSQAD